MENNKNQTPVTEEVKEWSIDFMKSVETGGYESMVRKLNELTPELRVGVLDFLKMVTDYCVKNDLNVFLEGVDNYKKLINISPRRQLKSVELNPKLKGYLFGKSNNKCFYSSRRERRKEERELLRQKKVG